VPSLRVPVSWLREYVDISVEIDELAERLHMSGTEVDHVERAGQWDRVWVGRIASLEKHPDADKLLLAGVEYGDGRRSTVVTGAPNLAVGAIVPYAETGAAIRQADGTTSVLEPKKMRGIVSAGMVLSERELGLGQDHDGILILDAALPVGARLADVMGETIIAVEVAPNRPDLLSIVGVAREAAALLRTSLRDLERDTLGKPVDPKLLSVRIDDPAGCPRFAAAYLEDVRIAPSPTWMQERLRAAGMRPINNVVDVTNYAMLELGQPLHAYDATRLAGRALVARRATRGERIRTLDDVERLLRPTDLVIADEERALGIAGILGGEDSEVRDATTTVALECASFEPLGVRRTADAHGLQGSSGSAAARRFGLGLSPNLVPLALGRAVRLLREHAGARLIGSTDVYPAPRTTPNVRLRFSDVTRVVGMEVSREETIDALGRLGFTTADDGDTLVVTPPALRMDIAIAEDVVEEVARIVGYDRIPTRIPSGTLPLHETHPLELFRERVRDLLIGFGLQETISYAAIDPAWLARLTADAGEDAAPERNEEIAPEPLRISNPTTVAQSVMRTTLRPSILDTASRNLRHRDGVAIFEIAPVYLPRPNDLPEERWTIEVLLAGRADEQTWLTKPRDWDRWDVKGILRAMADGVGATMFSGPAVAAPGLHPGTSSTRLHDGRPAITIGQLDPRVAQMWDLPAKTFLGEVDLVSLMAVVEPRTAKLPPRFPSALRDVAFVVDEKVAYGDAAVEIREAAKGLVELVSLLDLYRGPQIGDGKKSFAVRVVLRSPDATLSEADVEKAMKRIEGRLLHKLGATVRG